MDKQSELPAEWMKCIKLHQEESTMVMQKMVASMWGILDIGLVRLMVTLGSQYQDTTLEITFTVVCMSSKYNAIFG